MQFPSLFKNLLLRQIIIIPVTLTKPSVIRMGNGTVFHRNDLDISPVQLYSSLLEV